MNRALLKRSLALLLCLCVLLPAWALADDETDPLSRFMLKHGFRDSPMIAITVDDCYESATDQVLRDLELCREYGIQMTFFPIVVSGCLSPEYRDLWQSVLDTGCEIGSHTKRHNYLGSVDDWLIMKWLGGWQEALDQTLGYHYEARWVRAPFGNIADNLNHSRSEARVTRVLKLFGYEHVVHWEISETLDMNKLLKKVKNGSILLFHARNKDTKFLEKVIPALLEAGYKPVTLSEMFGFDPPETGGELYVYNEDYYRQKYQEEKQKKKDS